MATSMGQDLEIYQPDAQVGELKLWRAPETVLAEAKSAAQSLQKILAGKDKKVMFNGEQYLELEDWETLGHFYGYSTKIESTNFVQFGDVIGYEASALLVNEHTGIVVGRAESMCLTDEENWGSVPVYEWKNREKVKIGEKPKPLFQLRSMAQTRASAKAFRHKLAWVAVLAGYKPTPAEEVSEDTLPNQEPKLPTEIKRKESPDPVSTPAAAVAPTNRHPGEELYTPARTEAPKPAARPQVQAPRSSSVRTISEAQGRRFYGIWKSAGKTKDQVDAYLRQEIGVQSDRDIPVDRYNAACAWAEGGNF